MIMKEKQ